MKWRFVLVLAWSSVFTASVGCETEKSRRKPDAASADAQETFDAGFDATGDAGACTTDGDCAPAADPCQRAVCLGGACQVQPLSDGVSCDDGLVCTTADVCREGRCGGVPRECDDGLACSQDSCNESQGGCVANKESCPCTQDRDCSDGNACNGMETCDPLSLTCLSGAALSCGGLDTACTIGQCNPTDGSCQALPRPSGTSCSDGNPCTLNDRCTAGLCSGTAITCTAKDACHEAGVCDPGTGSCSEPAKPDGTTCDDGSLCTQADVCKSGTCEPGTPTTCVAIDDCHEAGVCNPTTGSCSQPLAPDGTACNDGLQCTTGDVCAAGTCSGAPRVCDDGLACSMDSCTEAAGCTANVALCQCTRDEDCSDGNACNGIETCNLTTRSCAGGTPKDCSGSDDACNLGVCDPSSGACLARPRPNGTTCDDGNACSRTDTCQAGTCTGSNPVTCSASDQCHLAGTCNPQSGACSNPTKPNGSACNDGNACTQSDSCQGGACTGADPVVCTALGPCHTAGTCNPSTGTCSNPLKPDGTTCNDGNACTRADACQLGTCVGGNPVLCVARDQCHTAGSCNPASGVCSQPTKPDGATCNDGNACTRADTCRAGSCTGDDPVVCQAKDQCQTAGVCDSTSGTCSDPPRPNGTSCDDGNACTRTDRCESGACSGADPVVCQPKDACHVAGVCNPLDGVCSNPTGNEGASCDDGRTCTRNDRCQTGTCTGLAVICDDGIACTVDGCDEAQGGCVADTSKCGCTRNADCDDRNACTGTESCDPKTLTCTPGSPVDCSRLSDACNVGTCEPANGACAATPRPDGTACDDNDACTRTDVCSTGRCAGTNPVLCPAPTECQNAGTCDSDTGTCTLPDKPNGSVCDDGNACTLRDQCASGRCVGSPRICNTPPKCQIGGMCNKDGTCGYQDAPNGQSCDDGNSCTLTDACASGACSGQRRDNRKGDWNLAPSSKESRILSADLDALDGGTVIVGTYSGSVDFGGKTLAVPAPYLVGAYFALYDRDGKLATVTTLAAATPRLRTMFEVNDVAVHKDGSFVIVGAIDGQLLWDGQKEPYATQGRESFVAAFDARARLRWIRRGTSGSARAVAIDAYDDFRVMVAGHVLELVVLDAGSEKTQTLRGSGTYAAVYTDEGSLVYSAVVATQPVESLKVACDDRTRLAAFQGNFSGQMAVGPKLEWTLPGLYGKDVALFALDSNGNGSWAHQIATRGDDLSGGVASAGFFASFFSTAGNGAVLITNGKTAVPLRGVSSGSLQAHLLTLKPSGEIIDAALIASEGGSVRAWDVSADATSGELTVLGTFVRSTQLYGAVGFGQGAPANPERTLTGPTDLASLFAARFFGEAPRSRWAVDLKGVGAGFGLNGNDVFLIAHPDQSATAGGVFGETARFGDVVVDELQPGLGSAFLCHFNSQAQYDHCP